MISQSTIKKIYKSRAPWSRKGQHGKLLVVGGSLFYSGSPIFNALSALRSGCDLVMIEAPHPVAMTIRSYSPDLIAYPLRGDFLSKIHVKAILEMQGRVDAMVIGGGLGRNKSTLEAVSSIISRTKIPCVVDADAVYAVKKLGSNFVVTPHAYEFFVLSGERVDSDVKKRVELAKETAAEIGCTILLKGHVDIITDGKRVEQSSTGNPIMAKGGFGDTLAGICGALLARGVAPFEAASAAAWINGTAGSLAAKRLGEGMIASDLINEIPNAIM